MPKTTFTLGAIVDADGDRTDDIVRYDAGDLTTHGVIVGMTGSGKTGLGIIFIEEAIRSGLPALILDPKGDMTNLLLTFPDLAPKDFEPWIDKAQARREDSSPTEVAEKVAQLWKSGLGSWGLDGTDIAQLRATADFTIYTPGSQAGVPLNILGSLAAPEVDWDEDAEVARDEIEGFVSGLLALVGVEADPLSSREHILVSNIVERTWRKGTDLSLETLIGMIHKPPMRKLGVFEVDSFFPEKDRLQLAMRLNALIASPSFADWRLGPPLDIERLLWDAGKPQASILYLAHLSDEERQFVVTMILGRLITWMRSQPGSSDLRALIYMDEVFGFVPPTAAPPAKKPILTILKQARAFGIGMILSTQNPVDLDYKAMSNAGTWCIGRLQTERDKARILEALQSATGDVDIDELDTLVSGLGKRTFLLHNTRDRTPSTFTTRWAMSYLRGPLTRDELSGLTADDPRRSEMAASAPLSETADEDGSVVAPEIAPGVPIRFLDPGAPWADDIGASRSSKKYEPGLAARVHLTFDDRNAGVDHDEEWEAIYFPIAQDFDPGTAHPVDHDDRDFMEEAPSGATFVLPEAPIHTKQWFSGAKPKIKDYLYRNRSIEIFRNPSLKVHSRVGETRADFENRCIRLADDAADAAVAALKKKYEVRIERARDQIDRAMEKVEDARLNVATRKQEELMSGAGTVLGVLLGRKSTRSLSTATSKRSMTRKAERRLETAQHKVEDEQEDIEDLEADMAGDVSDIATEWDDKAGDIEVFEIGLEKMDVSIDSLALVWIPVE